jgi:uncharacterized membrane protein
MSNQPEAVHAELAVYPDRGYADVIVTYFQKLEKSNLLHLEEVAVVTKDLHVKVTANGVGKPRARRGAALGAMAGGLIGFIFPPGIVGAAVVGAGIGGVTGRLRGRANHRAAHQELGERLDRGTSGVIIVAGDAVVDQVVERLTGCEALHRLRVDPKTLAELADEDGAGVEG